MGFCSLADSNVMPPDLCRLSQFHAVILLVCIDLILLKDFRWETG